MELSVENIERHTDPYQIYLNHFKNGETKRKYTRLLERFLKAVPKKIYTEVDIQPPPSGNVENLVNSR